MKRLIPFLIALIGFSCQHHKKNTVTLHEIEKDSSVKVFVQDTVKKDSLSYPVLCDTCLTADLALDSVQASYYQKELTELDVAKSIFAIKTIKKDLDYQLKMYKKYLAFLKARNIELEKELAKEPITKDTTNVPN